MDHVNELTCLNKRLNAEIDSMEDDKLFGAAAKRARLAHRCTTLNLELELRANESSKDDDCDEDSDDN